MHVEGTVAPETRDAARERYADLVPVAETVVRETARAMGFDRDELGERVTPAVVHTAHDALFASLLEVRVGTREEFDDWIADRSLEPDVIGSEQVDRVVWHAVPFAGRVAAATFQDEEDAAVATLRRRVFGRYYRDVVAEGEAGEGDDDGGDDRGEDSAGGGASEARGEGDGAT
jgi:hypothetical protein